MYIYIILIGTKCNGKAYYIEYVGFQKNDKQKHLVHHKNIYMPLMDQIGLMWLLNKKKGPYDVAHQLR